MTMSLRTPQPIGGYVLAGGRSSRMGTDKALLQLAGKPLIAHALAKLRRICLDVYILSGNPAHASYAPLVTDLHPNCGPLGGIEAALTHSAHDWNLILPVDIPFLPTAFLDHWIGGTLADASRGVRIALFTVDRVPQPTLLLVHRDAAPYISGAIARGDLKFYPALESAARELASDRGLELGRVLCNATWGEGGRFRANAGRIPAEPWRTTTPAQQAAIHLWFANLNTPQEFAEAEAHIGALDT
jgi:molybdopterin-guanine dinucleotide biosynthesis protein A